MDLASSLTARLQAASIQPTVPDCTVLLDSTLSRVGVPSLLQIKSFKRQLPFLIALVTAFTVYHNARFSSSWINAYGTIFNTEVAVAAVAAEPSVDLTIVDSLNVVYCVDMTYDGYMPREASETFRQSVLSIFQHASRHTLARLRIFIFLTSGESKSKQVITTLNKFILEEYGVNLTIIQTKSDIVTPNRTVWGYKKDLGVLTKLKNPANYLRFYLPELLPADISKFFYFDYDVVTVGDLAGVYDSHANGNVTLAAGVQTFCQAAKMFVMDDERLVGLGIKPDDPCIASAIILVNRKAWIQQKRRNSIEGWLAENQKKKLWHLGSLSPLMTEFAGEWQHLPPNLVGDNKAFKFATTSQKAIEKGAVLLHSVKDPRFVAKQRTWFQVTISSEHDMLLIPHIVSHYKSLKIPPHQFLIIVHNKNGTAPELREAVDLLHDLGVDNVLRWVGVYSSDDMNKKRHKIRADAKVEKDDWVVHADSDQFHEFPLNDAPLFLRVVEDLRYDAVYGYYIDRVSDDGTLRNITPTPSLAEQFPLACYVSTQVVQLNNQNEALNRPSKILAFKGRLSENRGGGMLAEEKDTCVYPGRLRSHHYKWVWPLIAKMELRAVVQKDLTWHYQSTNVLDHLGKNDGKIGVKEKGLHCEREKDLQHFPASSVPVNACKKYKYLDDNLQRLPK